MSGNSSCFWSLLSLDDLRFIYIPEYVANIKVSGTYIKEILSNHSLYEFIHPNEIELAKCDLSSFLKIKTLSGSVTRLVTVCNYETAFLTQLCIRCRLRSFDNIVESHFSPSSSLLQQVMLNFNLSSQIYQYFGLKSCIKVIFFLTLSQDFNTVSDYYKFNKTTSSTDRKNAIWRIIDLVIYTATDDTVLVFFHNTGIHNNTSNKKYMHNLQLEV